MGIIVTPFDIFMALMIFMPGVVIFVLGLFLALLNIPGRLRLCAPQRILEHAATIGLLDLPIFGGMSAGLLLADRPMDPAPRDMLLFVLARVALLAAAARLIVRWRDRRDARRADARSDK